MRQELKVIAVGLAVFAVYLPVAMFINRDYIEPPRPRGNVIEMMRRFHHDKPDNYVARSIVFNPKRFPDISNVRVYEDLTPLPKENISFTPDDGARVVRFKTSDGSDPRTNGRQYWVVAP